MADRMASKSQSEIELLYEFLENLPASDYQIDTRQYLVLNDLLLALVSQGAQVDAGLKTFIAPVICSTPEEQKDFYERFDRWQQTWAPSLAAVERGSVSHPPPQRKARMLAGVSGMILFGIFGGLLSLGVGFVIASLLGYVTSRIPSINFADPILAGLVIAGVIAFAGWRARIYYEDHKYITRALSDQTPVHQSVPIRRYADETLPAIQFKTVVKALRRRIQVPSTEVNVDETIEKALHNNKWLEFVYYNRQVMPEYVVLIDRKSHQDQQARFVQELLQRLSKSGVWVHPYEFDGDPRLCFPLGRNDSALQLRDLQTRYQDARLLIFSGTSELIHPNTGDLREWVDQLWFWKYRAILTPDPIRPALREALRAYGLNILPLSLDSFPFVASLFDGQKKSAAQRIQLPLPEPLVERPARWLERIAPPEEEIDELLVDLRDRYLGANGFYWLCALAVYPELRWEITLFLGNHLRDAQQKPLYRQDLMIRLARLPWLRQAYMPDWMRLKLIDSLEPAQNKTTRAVLADLLNPESERKSGDYELQIARETSKQSLARLKKLIRARFRRAKPGSPERDFIFVKFMTGRENQKLGVSLPMQLRKFFAPVTFWGSSLVSGAWNVFRPSLQSRSGRTAESRQAVDQKDLRAEEIPSAARRSETTQRAPQRAPTYRIRASLWSSLLPEINWDELDAHTYESILEALSKTPDLAAVAQFMKTRRVRIGFARQYKSGGGWTLLGNITLSPGEDPLSPYALSLILHETFHLRQSLFTRLSVQGELRAWQYQKLTYRLLTGRDIGADGEAYRGTKQLWDQLAQLYPESRADLEKARRLMTDIAPGFQTDALPLYPLPQEVGYLIRQGQIGASFELLRNLVTPRKVDAQKREEVTISETLKIDEKVKSGAEFKVKKTKEPASEIDKRARTDFFGASIPKNVPIVRAAYSDQMAWLLAKMSQLAYDRFEEDGGARKLFVAKLQSGRFELNATFNSPETDTQAFLASNGEFAVLAFRGAGAAKAQDVKVDVSSVNVSMIQGRVHSGFLQAYKSLEAGIVRQLSRLEGLPIYITGHSLGAALATIATERLEHHRVFRGQIAACYTFGSPRVGNSEYDREFKAPIYRVVNTNDIVTMLPLLSIGFVHLGDVRYLGRREGEIRRGIPLGQRSFFFLAALFGLFESLVRDHAITEYVRKLEIIARTEHSRSSLNPYAEE